MANKDALVHFLIEKAIIEKSQMYHGKDPIVEDLDIAWANVQAHQKNIQAHQQYIADQRNRFPTGYLGRYMK